ncbi:hypothetical protein WS9_003785 [Paraclostridium sordellii 8483]|uniref:phage tail terminator protein n=1 Tax=Paraclostridium sordellii TaxID=1505 RepID=UPI00030271B1|nr:minor capsid protein [Paeniclostridium sordellii]TAN69152.1 hypothetical protein WS9_003785 [Paeniclostridium sordellii 8483]
MLLGEVREYLKSKIDCPQWYIGKIDGNKEQCIGIYNIQGPKNNIALGGLKNTSYSTKAISILIHWGKNANIAEQKAQEVYNSLFGQQGIIGSKRVINFDMRNNEPISVGTDKNGIYEYVIEVNIIHER